MNAVRKLALSSICTHKIRSVVVCAAVILTSVLFMTVVSITSNIFSSVQLMLMLAGGSDFHAVIFSSGFDAEPSELLDRIKSDKSVSEAYLVTMKSVSECEALDISDILAVNSEKALKHLFITLTEGEFPKDSSEIALNSSLFPDAEIGQRLTLSCVETTEINGASEFREFSRDCVVSALFTSEADAKLPTLTSLDAESETSLVSVYILFHNQLNISGKLDALTGSLSDIAPDGDNLHAYVNNAFLTADTSMFNPANVFVVLFAVSVVFFCAFLLIYNIYSIALSQDIRSYGLLSVIGATYRQLQELIRTQTLILFAFSAPVGIIAGYFIGWRLLAPVFMTMSGQKLNYRFNVWIIVLSMALTLFTLLYSALRPMRRIKRMTPVEAVNAGVKLSAKTKKKPSEVNPFRLGLNSAARNPRRLTVTAMSAALSVTLVMLVSSSVGMVRDIGADELSQTDISLRVNVRSQYAAGIDGTSRTYVTNPDIDSGKCAMDPAILDEIKKVEGVGSVWTIRCAKAFIAATERNIADAEEMYAKLPEDILEYNDTDNLKLIIEGKIPSIFVSVPDELCRYISVGKDEYYSGGEFYDGKHTLAFESPHSLYFMDENGYRELEFPVLFGDGDAVISDSLSHAYTAIKTDSLQSLKALQRLTGSFSWEFGTELFILPESVFEREFGEGELYAVLCNYNGEGKTASTLITEDERSFKTRIEAVAEKYVSENDGGAAFVNVSGRFDGLEELQTRIFAISLTGYSLCAIIFVIGLINIVNSSLSSVTERRREFAMLEAVGMTGRQLRAMMLTEGMAVGALSAAASLLIGLPAIKLLLSAAMDESVKLYPEFALMMLGALFVVSAATSLVSYDLLRRSPLSGRLRIE